MFWRVPSRFKLIFRRQLDFLTDALDDAVMDTTKAWAADVRRRWHIGDFAQWKHYDIYQQSFDRLLHDLKASKQR